MIIETIETIGLNTPISKRARDSGKFPDPDVKVNPEAHVVAYNASGQTELLRVQGQLGCI